MLLRVIFTSFVDDNMRQGGILMDYYGITTIFEEANVSFSVFSLRISDNCTKKDLIGRFRFPR